MCGAGALTLEHQTLIESQLRGPRFESSCCHFKAWAILFTPRCLSSLCCIDINKYLAIDSGG